MMGAADRDPHALPPSPHPAGSARSVDSRGRARGSRRPRRLATRLSRSPRSREERRARNRTRRDVGIDPPSVDGTPRDFGNARPRHHHAERPPAISRRRDFHAQCDRANHDSCEFVLSVTPGPRRHRPLPLSAISESSTDAIVTLSANRRTAGVLVFTLSAFTRTTKSRHRTQRDSANHPRCDRSAQRDRSITYRSSSGTQHLERFARSSRFHPQCPRSNDARSENRAQHDFANGARYQRHAQRCFRQGLRLRHRTERREPIAEPTRFRAECSRANAPRSEDRAERDFRASCARTRAVERRSRSAFCCRRHARRRR